MSHAFPHENRHPLPNRILPCPMLPSLSCHCRRNTNSLSSPILPSQCSLLVIMLQFFRPDLTIRYLGLHSVPYGLHFSLRLPNEISATISYIPLKINDARPQIKTFHHLSCKVTHCHCTSISLPLEDEIIYLFHVSYRVVKPKKLKLWIWVVQKLCFDPYN